MEREEPWYSKESDSLMSEMRECAVVVVTFRDDAAQGAECQAERGSERNTVVL